MPEVAFLGEARHTLSAPKASRWPYRKPTCPLSATSLTIRLGNREQLVLWAVVFWWTIRYGPRDIFCWNDLI